MKQKSPYSLKRCWLLNRSFMCIIHTDAQSHMYTRMIQGCGSCHNSASYAVHMATAGKDGNRTCKCFWRTKTMESVQEDSCLLIVPCDLSTVFLSYWKDHKGFNYWLDCKSSLNYTITLFLHKQHYTDKKWMQVLLAIKNKYYKQISVSMNWKTNRYDD